ncbi:MAG: hypothetical protein LBJ17_08680 [Dysgonamonadaceae bacterium]|jgi:hypothetical protein|nr:hypothetical protein [Dysgonamonadaceae bacterium]
MKNKSITFAAYFAKVYFVTIVSVVFFIATNTALYAANIGYQIPAVCCTSIVSKCTLASLGGDSLSFLLNFSFAMPKYNEDASKVKHSSRTSTPTERNTVSTIEAYNGAELPTTQVNQLSPEIQAIISVLKENKSTVVLVVNVTNNNTTIGDTNASNISIAATKDATAISGHSNQIPKGNLPHINQCS